MIIIYLLIMFRVFCKKLNKYGKGRRQRIFFVLCIFLIVMMVYEWYVESAVGWAYGVPYDDDTGWIFKSAAALHDGSTWNKLYLLVQSASYDAANRGLSINNFGQYIYATWVSTALYYPTVFDLHINLYLLYAIQGLCALIAGMDIAEILCDMVIKENGIQVKKKPFLSIFYIFVFCPIVQFNTYKLLRESWYLYFMVEATAEVYKKKNWKEVFIHPKALLFALFCMVLRPHAVIWLLPAFVYFAFSKHIGKLVSCFICGILVIGTSVIAAILSLIGWSYQFGTVSIPEAIHLLFFPNVINQFSNLSELANIPSWTTILYFLQSVWNVFAIVMLFIGIIWKTKIFDKNLFWLVQFFNTLILYTIPYSTENMTPRYKLLFVIPMMYFIARFFCVFNKYVKVKSGSDFNKYI